jgi:hypothetical protein
MTHLDRTEKNGCASHKFDGKLRSVFAEDAYDKVFGGGTFALVYRGISEYNAQDGVYLSVKLSAIRCNMPLRSPFGGLTDPPSTTTPMRFTIDWIRTSFTGVYEIFCRKYDPRRLSNSPVLSALSLELSQPLSRHAAELAAARVSFVPGDEPPPQPLLET